MRRGLSVIVFLAAAGLAASLATTACSLLTSLDGFSSGDASIDDATDDGVAPAADATRDGDGASIDAATETATPLDAGDDAGGPNLHPRGTFEDGTCDGWTSYQGALSASSVARTGAWSCMTCTAAGTTDFFTADDLGAPGPGVVGATYRAEAWVRTAPAKPAPGSVLIFLRSFTLDPAFRALETSPSPERILDAPWQRIETTMKVTQPGGTLNVFIGANHAPGACFLIDDITVRRID